MQLIAVRCEKGAQWQQALGLLLAMQQPALFSEASNYRAATRAGAQGEQQALELLVDNATITAL